MGTVQYLLVTNGIWTLGATGGAMAGMLVGVGLTRIPFTITAPNAKSAPESAGPGCQAPLPAKRVRCRQPSQPISCWLYWLFGLNLIKPVEAFLDQFQYTLFFPEITTALGWVTPAEPGRYISLFNHPGAILLYSSIIAYLIYHRAGYYQPGALGRILKRVASGGC
jgi:lactate permease